MHPGNEPDKGSVETGDTTGETKVMMEEAIHHGFGFPLVNFHFTLQYKLV
jgi:hypothetical protein